jgi:hypothetical protein
MCLSMKYHALKGVFTQKPLGHGCQNPLRFSLVESVMGPTLGLHKGSFGPEPITSLVDEKSTWNPTRQVWIMLAGIVGNFFWTALESRPYGICGGNSILH